MGVTAVPAAFPWSLPMYRPLAALFISLAFIPGLALAGPPAIGDEQLSHIDARAKTEITTLAEGLAALQVELEAARADLATLQETSSLAKADLTQAKGDLAATKDEAGA